MSSSTGKKSHSSKSKQSVPSKSKQSIPSKLKYHLQDEDEDDDGSVVDDAAPSFRLRTSKVVMDPVYATPLPRPVPRTLKVVHQSNDVLELTTSEGGEDAEASDTLESGSEVADSDADAVVVNDVKSKSVRTRLSNGISKKRFLKDAAIFSDEDSEFPRTISPKKSRLNSNAHDFRQQDEDYNQLSDTGFAEIDDSLSLSPLKLHLAMQRRQVVEPTIDPFDVGSVLQKPIVLKTSKVHGKKKLATLPVESVSTLDGKDDDDDLHPDESANIARAIAESTRNLLVHSGNTAGSSSSGRTNRNNDSTAGTGATHLIPPQVNVMQTVANVQPVGNIAVSGGTTATVRRSFKDMFPNPKTTPIMSNSPLYYKDQMKYCVRELPKTCQVTDPSIQDEFLAGDYNTLPPLTAGALRSWHSEKAGMALVTFTQWASQCPNMSFDIALAAVRFVRYKNYINPSRISPLEVNILYTTHDRKRSLLQCNMRTAICLSPLLSRDSYLIKPSSYGIRNKYVSGHFHSQEWQRFEGFVTMAFDKPLMTAQIYNDALSFSTMGNGKSSEGSSPSKAPRHAAILSLSNRLGSNAPDQPKRLVANTSIKTVLDSTDDVPIYDARQHPFNFASDLEDVASVLPRIYEEIPPHSFIVVAYTLAHYDKEGSANLSTNVLFAILVGTEYA